MNTIKSVSLVLACVLVTHYANSESYENVVNTPAYELASAHTGLMVIANTAESHKQHVQLLEIIATGNLSKIEEFANKLLRQDFINLRALVRVYQEDGRLLQAQEFRGGLQYLQSQNIDNTK